MLVPKFSTRVQMLVGLRGLSSVSQLARDLGYAPPEKLLRITRSESAQPGADIIADVARIFVNLNLRWWLTGEGAPLAWGGRLLTSTEADIEFPSWHTIQTSHPGPNPGGYKSASVVPSVLAEPPPSTRLDVLADILEELRGLRGRVAAIESHLKGGQ